MPVRLDHIFICTAAGAPAAERLRQFGLTEGSPNQHPGQGTACRRFFFRNFMLELIWIENASDVQSEQTRTTRLWERCSASAASPFGVILGPDTTSENACPFPSWDYRPKTVPDLKVQIATGTTIEEPMWCYIERARAPADAPADRRQPLDHPAGIRELSSVRLVCPPQAEQPVTRAMANRKIISLEFGTQHLLELQFDGGQETIDLRPDLPLVLRYAREQAGLI